MKHLRLRYQKPLSLLEEAEEDMAAVPQDRLFNDAKYRKLTEKWCAGMLGLGYEKYVSPCRVAVNETKERMDVDLSLEIDRQEYPFQLVEAMEPGRKRGAEFK